MLELKIGNTTIKIVQEITGHLQRLQRKKSKHPIPTVDVIIEAPEGVVLVDGFIR